MKEKINLSHSYCHKGLKDNTDPFFCFPLKIKNSTEKKYNIYINHKSSLETLLNLIKNFQMDYLSQYSQKKNCKNKRQLLLSLKDNLNIMLKEKNKRLNFIKGENDLSKKKLQKMLFPPKASRIIKENKKNNNNMTSYISEKNELQLLNFQIENEIEKTRNLYEQKLQIHTYIKTLPFYFEVNREIFCNNNYETYVKTSEILNDIIKKVRKDFIEVVKKKMKLELEINNTTIQINYIKNNIETNKYDGCRKYIESDDIIQEESKEFTKSLITCQSKRNSISSNILKQLSYLNQTSNKYLKKIKERKIKDKYTNINKPYINDNNKDLFNDINNNKVSNYLNMNINVNINLNNNNNNNKYIQESFNSSLDSDNNEEKNKKYEVDLNNKNKIIITPMTSTENNDRNGSEKSDSNSIKSNSNDNGSFVLNMHEK